ncbi:T-cell differentiation antigen CD6 isoform X2 [Pteropus medius]|uniref:T-cell differentiation antigen CD6 isoform X2 n=1 Tax=Pteropus vampyrus TaxID=132908 RepID=UPI00196B10E0|nr:T-cell differentiation antigen CD6 isoform X2 [Pteropus giganteus]
MRARALSLAERKVQTGAAKDRVGVRDTQWPCPLLGPRMALPAGGHAQQSAMTPDMWFFFVTAGLLTVALSGHPSPAPSGQPDTSSAESHPLEPGEQLGVRLVNGSSLCNGTVEVRLGQSWQPVCEAFWNLQAAEAVCRALGCGGAAGSPVQPPPTPELPRNWALGNASGALNVTQALAPAILCGGAEWQLCEVVEHPCIGNQRPAQVTCAENRALRLADGGSSCAGRVEMLEHGQWGSVCDDTWDLEDAHVVCRQLSCGWAIQALPGLHFAPGQGLIHRDQVNCSGVEAYLWDCPGLPGDRYCGHKEDAGVVCSEHQSLRLTGGRDSCEGQVEVHFRGVWNTVCDSEWYTSEAQVLCRALGCGTVARIPKGLPHSLSGRMYYSCKGEEPTLSDCSWRFNNSNLCSQSKAARVLCSGSRSLLNLSTPEVPASVQPVTVEPSVKTEDQESRELILLILCIILGVLLLGSLIVITVILLKGKGKYDSQRHRVTEEEVRQNRFQMPPLEEEDHASQAPPVNPGHRIADPLSLSPQQHPRSDSESSTSSGEDYCNSPSRKLPPWNPQGFSSERTPFLEPPNLELAGSQATFSGPSADDSSSTSSGEWYQNYKPPPQPPPMEQFGCPGSPSPQPDSTDNDDYDDIGAA